MSSENERKIHVGRLDLETTEDDLRNYLSTFGELEDVTIIRFPDSKKSRQYGFAIFANAGSVEPCLNAAPHLVGPATIEIARAKGRGARDSRYIDEETSRKVFIGRLDFSTSDETLRDYFVQFGEIVDCLVMRNKENNKSRGFGFVTYKDESMVDAVQEARPHNIDGRTIETRRAVPKEDAVSKADENCKKVFVGGIKDGISDDDLKEYFSQFGTVLSAEHKINKETNRPRGFGFIEFDDTDPVDKIIQRRHIINGFNLECKKAVPRDNDGGSGGNFNSRNNNPRNDFRRDNSSRGGGGGFRGSDNFYQQQQPQWGGSNPQNSTSFQGYGGGSSAMSPWADQSTMGGMWGNGAPQQNNSWGSSSFNNNSDGGGGPMRNSFRKPQGNQQPYGRSYQGRW